MRRRWLLSLCAVATAVVALGLAGCSGSSGGGGTPKDTTAPTVSAAPLGGTYEAAQAVTLAATDNRDKSPVIYYTIDGSDPDGTSAQYSGPIAIGDNTVLKFFSRDTAGNASAIVTETYVIADGAVGGTTPTPSDDLQAIAARVAAVLALGYNTTNPDVVAKALMDEDPANDPFVVDTREAADYAKGHIPGAINIPLQTLPQALLDGTSGIPLDQEVIVASYWGNDGNMASLLINAYRVVDPANKAAYPKSTALFQGMTSWSFDRELVPANTRFEDAQAAGIVVERATETTAHPGTDQGAYPSLHAFPSDDVVQKVLIRARDYLNSVPTQFDLQVYPSTVAAMIDAGDTPQIVSVRAGSAYASGHIPGAINIAYQQVADLANYTKFVNPGETVYVYCYTGHTGSLSSIALGILGYPARDVLYGMNGWTQNAAVGSGQLANFDLLKAWDFPVDDGGAGDLGSLAAFVPASGCQGCHTDLTSIFYDREIANPPAAAVAPPSEGEG